MSEHQLEQNTPMSTLLNDFLYIILFAFAGKTIAGFFSMELAERFFNGIVGAVFLAYCKDPKSVHKMISSNIKTAYRWVTGKNKIKKK